MNLELEFAHSSDSVILVWQPLECFPTMAIPNTQCPPIAEVMYWQFMNLMLDV